MGESAAATVREIEETRDRLEEELTELQERMPRPAVWIKRLVGFAVGGGTAATLTLMALRRRRNKKREAAAAVPVNAVIQVVPDQWAERLRGSLEDGAWKPWVAGAAGVYVALRLVEIRQLRRVNRALLAGAR